MQTFLILPLLLSTVSLASPLVSRDRQPDWIAGEIAYAETHDIALQPNHTDIGKRGVLLARYNDGEGRYLGSDGNHQYASGVKCWNDYFVVEQNLYNDPWRQASSKVYCTKSQSCQATQGVNNQVCETTSFEISAGIMAEFVTASISVGHQTQTCSGSTSLTACTWNDQGCHVIWSQQQMLSQKGYQRRRCTSSNGDYTAWTKFLEKKAPTEFKNYGCGSSCNDSF
ncbi:hypothetical protein CMEL01_03466 [Colletotrichum melonis]|uniref:Secreted protein n=1 Tax=Colletotrichum melonis TaxID=1209925 RepID=A0AAI9XM10_9PEZI|nr:hypothetical protein CMEL01_03466 [Colletotrichum melonis]